MTDEADVERLYEHLAVTAELPVDRKASRLLGEAEAVADDMRDCGPAVVADRAGVVLELLKKIETTGHEEADRHLEAAREIAEGLATGAV